MIAPAACGAEREPVVQALTAPSTPLGRSLRVMSEPGPELSVDEVLRLADSGRFRSYDETVLGFGLTHRPVWAHLVVENASDQPLLRRLVIAPSWLDRVDVHLLQDGRMIERWSTGDEHAGVPYLNEALGYVLEATLPPGRSDVFIRIETPDPMVLEVRLLSPLAAEDLARFERYSYGFLYGFVFSLATYNLMLFLGMRRWPSLYYAVYLLSFIALNLCYTGRGLAWLWPDSPYLQRYVILTFIVLTPCTGLRFAREFLELDRRTPRLARMVALFYWFTSLLLCLTIVMNQHAVAVWLAFCTMGLFIPAMVALGAYSVRQGHGSARYFLYAALASMIGMGLTEFSTWGFLPFTTFTYRGVEIGMMLDATLLALAIADYVRRQALERERAEREARIDVLTQLNNRRGFLELAEAPYRSAERHQRPLAMILLDLDRFKEINDEHGHAAGDAVLNAIGQTLAVSARRSDIVGRWGGEEFVLLLPETSLDEAVELAERLREQLRERVIRHEGAELRMTASFGVAALEGQQDLALLIDAADKALYAAKMAGRDRVRRVS
jgi:diguanylate cyclase (GGDEF)-like protein